MRSLKLHAFPKLQRWLISGLLLAATGCNAMTGSMSNQTGTSYYQQGNYSMARDEFRRAVANDPRNADYIGNMAAAMKRQGDLAGAEKTYRQAIQVDPSHQPSYHGLALLLKEQGRLDEASELLTGWVNQQPYSSEPYVELAWLKRETGDIPGTEQLLLNALRVQPNDSIAMAQLGQLYQDTNQPERAAAMYQRSLHAKWNQPAVQSRLTHLQQPGPRTGYAALPVTTATPGQPLGASPPPFPTTPPLGPTSYLAPDRDLRMSGAQPISPRVSSDNADPAHTAGPDDLPVEPH
ncbi:MAG: tetratricopeptide repeat protein [Planctomycetes bacterium]|nr:tetratricopeptide repeat protein [Planctomycetota bacterium]